MSIRTVQRHVKAKPACEGAGVRPESSSGLQGSRFAPRPFAVQRKPVPVRPTLSSPQGVVQGVLTDRFKLYNARWAQGILEAWGGASQLLVNQIIEDVGRQSWEAFLQMLNSEEEFELDDHPEARRIIRHLERSLRDIQRDAQRPRSLSLPPAPQPASQGYFSFSTHNIEKFGARTGNKQDKADQEMGLWDSEQPDIGSMQEVTRSDLFEEATQSNPEFTNQFQTLPGPQYQSGNYQESYSAAFNRGTVHFRPDLQYIDPETGEVTPYSEPLSFGKQAAQERGQPGLKQARPTSSGTSTFLLPTGTCGRRSSTPGTIRKRRPTPEGTGTCGTG